MRVRAPGKLMISGEWAVLEVGIPCIVAAVDKYGEVEIGASQEISVFAPDIGLGEVKAGFDGKELQWKVELDEKGKEKLLITKKAIELTLRYLADKGKKSDNFYIKTSSSDAIAELPNGQKTKVGFGSSAAICTAICAAILKFNGLDLGTKENKDLVYKLSATAHYLAQGKVGSAFDIAAATYGGAIIYKRFDPNWLIAEMNSGKGIAEIMDAEWPEFYAEKLHLPKAFIMSVGFVGYSASTKELILKLNSFKTGQKEHYWEIVNSIKGITSNLIEAIKNRDEGKILELIKENRRQLKELSDGSQNNLETRELCLLADIADKNGGAGKFSGAGGGDCGIAISFDADIAHKIESGWKENGIVHLDVKIAESGVG